MMMRLVLAAAAAAALAATPALAALATGAVAPDFTTRGATAGKISSFHLKEALKKGPVVLYFFPAAFTPGCSAEARAFAQAIPDFQKAGATVVGMSADPVEVLADFSNKDCAGQFMVASAGPAVVAGYDVALSRPAAGSAPARTITKRTSYVIAPDGRVTFVHDDMNPAEHVRLTLEAVRRIKPARG